MNADEWCVMHVARCVRMRTKEKKQCKERTLGRHAHLDALLVATGLAHVPAVRHDFASARLGAHVARRVPLAHTATEEPLCTRIDIILYSPANSVFAFKWILSLRDVQEKRSSICFAASFPLNYFAPDPGLSISRVESH